MLILLDGMNGAGKSLQAQMLRNRLTALGRKTDTLHFPRYDTPTGAACKAYLMNELVAANVYQSSTLFAIDRAMASAELTRDPEKIWVLDRYMISNLLHQMPQLPKAKWDEYIQWIQEFEVDRLQCPQPEITFMLKVSDEFRAMVMTQRMANGESLDRFEQDSDGEQKRNEAFFYCAQKLPRIEVVDCMQTSTEILPPEQIHQMIFNILQKKQIIIAD